MNGNHWSLKKTTKGSKSSCFSTPWQHRVKFFLRLQRLSKWEEFLVYQERIFGEEVRPWKKVPKSRAFTWHILVIGYLYIVRVPKTVASRLTITGIFVSSWTMYGMIRLDMTVPIGPPKNQTLKWFCIGYKGNWRIERLPAVPNIVALVLSVSSHHVIPYLKIESLGLD